MYDYLSFRGEQLKPLERELLANLAREIATRFYAPVIVNIGVSWGASVHCLHAGAPDARLIAIDLDFDTRPVQGMERLEYVEFVQADSGTYEYDTPIHLAFVDGGHSHEVVKADIKQLTPHIPTGGIIAFHDYKPAPRDAGKLKGVQEAVNEWRETVAGWAELPGAGSIAVFERVA